MPCWGVKTTGSQPGMGQMSTNCVQLVRTASYANCVMNIASGGLQLESNPASTCPTYWQARVLIGSTRSLRTPDHAESPVSYRRNYANGSCTKSLPLKAPSTSKNESIPVQNWMFGFCRSGVLAASKRLVAMRTPLPKVIDRHGARPTAALQTQRIWPPPWP